MSDQGFRTLTIHSTGEIEFVHTDAFEVERLGVPVIRRLSDVEPKDGEWVARDRRSGREIARHRSRSVCVAMEVAHYRDLQRRGARLFEEVDE